MAVVRSGTDKWIAEATGYESRTVRLVLALLMMCAGSGLLIYCILWAIMPRPTGGSLAEDGLREINRWRQERHR